MKFLYNIKRAVKKSKENRIFLISSSTAFYATVSLLPFLLILINILDFFTDKMFFIELINNYVKNPELANFLSIRLEKMPLLNIFILIFASTALFSSVGKNLNKIWESEKKGSPLHRILKSIKKRAISFLIIVIISVLIIFSFIALVISSSLNLEKYTFFSTNLFFLSLLLIIFVFSFLLFLFIFKFLPDKRTRWKKLIPGTFLTTILFIAGQTVIGIYFSFSEIQSAYSAISSFLVILINFYYSSIIFYFGAIYTYLTSK